MFPRIGMLNRVQNLNKGAQHEKTQHQVY